MEYIKLPHSIYSRDENGKILAKIEFPEVSPGVYCFDNTYVEDDDRHMETGDELMQMAVAQIREKHGKITATCPFAKKWLHDRGML